jgi:uncharacterized protein (TIGR02145 family)/uncharacterized repeat protein (TIGR02543 family)
MKSSVLSELLTVSALAAALALVSLSGCADISVSTPENMTITYNLKVESGSGGSVSPTTQNNIAAETPVSVKATPNSGYVFSHWSLTSGLARFNDQHSASTSVLLGWNATIKANFTPIYTVTFSINGATGTTPATVSQIVYGDTITLPLQGDMVKNGYKSPDSIRYTFGGWNTNSGGTGTNYSAGATYKVTSNVTLYARWIPVCTVKFDINMATSGDTPVTITADSGNQIKLPYQRLERTGYTLHGWNTERDGTGTNYDAGTYYTVRNNITIYAKWLRRLSVVFNGNGSTGGSVPATIVADSSKSITLPGIGNLTRTGYYFAGWNEKSDGTGANYGARSSYTVRSAIVLYAKWTQPVVGVFTDHRNEQTYRMAVIGNQTWMAENLNYDTADGTGSWCYGNSSDSCAKYGRLYDWRTAMGGSPGSATNPSGVRGVCPSGWHLPSNAEYNELVTEVGGSSTAGKILKSTSGWYRGGNGTDGYGFSALPGGGYFGGGFSDAGNYGLWWTATEGDASNAYYRGLYYSYDRVDEAWNNKSDGLSVRCVQD